MIQSSGGAGRVGATTSPRAGTVEICTSGGRAGQDQWVPFPRILSRDGPGRREFPAWLRPASPPPRPGWSLPMRAAPRRDRPPGRAEPAGRLCRADRALLRLLRHRRRLDRHGRRARLGLRRHRVPGADRAACLGPADPDGHRADRADRHRAGRQQHVPLLPAAGDQRRRRRARRSCCPSPRRGRWWPASPATSTRWTTSSRCVPGSSGCSGT